MSRQDLANRIGRLEASISEMTMEDELRRLSAIDKARAEYGDVDDMLLKAIARARDSVAQAQREGEYDYAD